MPMVLARATQSVITFADTFQVEHLGTGSIAAAATGGINVVTFALLPMGTVFIVGSFVSQLVGRGERDSTPRFAWYGLAIAAIAGLAAIALIPAIGPALSFTGYSPHVRAEMADYMQIRMLSVAAVVGVDVFGNWYGGLGNTWMQMICGVITMTAAVLLNWVLIDGHLGAPALGVAGAAWASVIASWLGFAFLAVAFWLRLGGAPRGRAKNLTGVEFRRVVRFGLPNGFTWFLELAAFQVFVNVVLARLGDEPVAALNAVLAINSISFMPAFGLASAGAILTGQAIGRGARDAVWPQVKITLLCTTSWMCLIGLLYFVAPTRVLSLFDSKGLSPNLVVLGSTMLALSAAWQVFDALGITLSEALRSAGDTKWIAIMRLVLAWFVFAPTAYLVVELGGGAVGAMICLVGYFGLVALATTLRFRSGAWRSIELLADQPV